MIVQSPKVFDCVESGDGLLIILPVLVASVVFEEPKGPRVLKIGKRPFRLQML